MVFLLSVRSPLVLELKEIKSGSDIDIAIYGQNITFDVLAKLHLILEDECPFPYLFDIIDMPHNVDQRFKEHVDRVGVVIYQSEI